jgi:hypothetical protein
MAGERKTLIILIFNSSCGVYVTSSSLCKGSEGTSPSLPEGLYLVSQRDISVTNDKNSVPGASNEFRDIFLRDRPEKNDDSTDGRYIFFNSLASNLIPGDLNSVKNVFIYDQIVEEIKRVSISDEDREASAVCENLEIFGNGKSVDLQLNSSRWPL